jgi:hypothetical protein
MRLFEILLDFLDTGESPVVNTFVSKTCYDTGDSQKGN